MLSARRFHLLFAKRSVSFSCVKFLRSFPRDSIMSEAAQALQEVAKIPFPISAKITKFQQSDPNDLASSSNAVVHATFSQRDFVRMEKTTVQKSYLLTWDGKKELRGIQMGVAADNSNEKSITYSADGTLKAVFSKFHLKGKKDSEEKESIEIYNSLGKIATNDLQASKRHGKFYTDAHIGAFHLSPLEGSTHVLYVAEKYVPKSESWFSVTLNKFPTDPDLISKGIGQEFVYRDDWGEQMQKKSQPVLAILDWADNNVSILDNISEEISPSQPIWTPDGSGVVFVGIDHLPERLGLVYCPIRKSRLYHLAFQSRMALPLTFEGLSVQAPRFSPDGKSLIYLETEVGGPHMRAMRLMKIDWTDECGDSSPKVIVPVPTGHIARAQFPGLYTTDFSKRCWASDSKRIILSSVWRSTQHILLVNTADGNIVSLTEGMMKQLPKWEVLDVHEDVIIASAAAPNVCPRIYAAKIPAEGEEKSIVWVLLDKGAASDENLEKEIGLLEWGIEEIKIPGSNLDFEALWMLPSLKKNPPVVLWPHGGPHSAIVAGFDLFVNTLVRLEFAVVFVNYRGSIGFGEENLRSLLGHIGTNDVDDCMRALNVMLGKWQLNQAETDLFIQGGSHGGFLAAHMIGQFPGVFKAAALRNPVVNMASKYCGTDIQDWGYVESGIEYPYDKPPVIPPYQQLLSRSPIIHVSKVTTPTILMIGEKDRRVPPQQGMEFYRALKLNGVPTKVLRYPDSEHPIQEIDAESDSFVQMVHWFNFHGSRTRKVIGE